VTSDKCKQQENADGDSECYTDTDDDEQTCMNTTTGDVIITFADNYTVVFRPLGRFPFSLTPTYYLRRRLVSGEDIVSLGVRLCVCVCVCPPSRDCMPH